MWVLGGDVPPPPPSKKTRKVKTMSEENKENENAKPDKGWRIFNDTATPDRPAAVMAEVMLNGVIEFEDADERCKKLEEGEFEIEVSYRIPVGKISTKAKMPAFLIGVAGKIAGRMARELDSRTDRKVKELAAFDAGYEAAKKDAAQKPATGGQQEATPSPSAQPEASTGGAEAK